MNSMTMDMMSRNGLLMPGMNAADMSVMQACMEACSAAEQACTVCAMEMMSCAPACMNCAAMCDTMLRSMLRMQGMTREVMISMLDTTMATCQMCMDKCMEDAEDNQVCKMCAESCKACIDACRALKDNLTRMV